MSEPSEKEAGALRVRARELIEQGRLPRARALRTWGGRGSGLRCDLCDSAITSDEPEFELQLEPIPSAEPVRFHRLCHAVWTEAREDSEPGGWRPVTRELPRPGVVVEARVTLGARRSIILSVICLSDESTVPPMWINATTRGPLPEGWLPIEWRPSSGAISPPSSAAPSSSGSSGPSDSSTGAAA